VAVTLLFNLCFVSITAGGPGLLVNNQTYY